LESNKSECVFFAAGITRKKKDILSMGMILNIDTAIEKASICLAKAGVSIAYAELAERNAQAAWLHQAIRDLLSKAGTDMQMLDAIAVSNGPGSYTGLRIGLATAKGLCFVLQKPLITLNTLMVMAHASANQASDLICPMIDARRMEVFTAVFDKNLAIVEEPAAVVLSADSFSRLLSNHPVLFTGNGAAKFKQLVVHPNARFMEAEVNATHMAGLAETEYINGKFNNLAYAEPYYLKSVHITK